MNSTEVVPAYMGSLRVSHPLTFMGAVLEPGLGSRPASVATLVRPRFTWLTRLWRSVKTLAPCLSIKVSLKAFSWAMRSRSRSKWTGKMPTFSSRRKTSTCLPMGDALQVFGLAVGHVQSRGDDAVQMAEDEHQHVAAADLLLAYFQGEDVAGQK